MSKIDNSSSANLNSLQNFTFQSGKLRTELTIPIEKFNKPGQAIKIMIFFANCMYMVNPVQE